jgi:hypothetical protein
MNELELIPTGFGLCWIAYYLRAIVRIHQSLAPNERDTSFTETWLRFWLSPAILKDSFRCALISVGVFLGIEIARGDSVENDIEEDSEIDHF